MHSVKIEDIDKDQVKDTDQGRRRIFMNPLGSPKCYTLINKMYDPTKDIRKNRNKIREWTNNLEKTFDDEQFDKIYETIVPYIGEKEFPSLDVPFYEEALEGWRLITRRNQLKKDYPRQYRQDSVDETREWQEIDKMMKEDDPVKIIDFVATFP
jgi:hypothetical protein